MVPGLMTCFAGTCIVSSILKLSKNKNLPMFPEGHLVIVYEHQAASTMGLVNVAS